MTGCRSSARSPRSISSRSASAPSSARASSCSPATRRRRTPGPPSALSFILGGIACGFAGLCYAEMASTRPGRRQRLHLRLCDHRRDRRLDHRLGPHPRIHARRHHGRDRLVGLRGKPAPRLRHLGARPVPDARRSTTTRRPGVWSHHRRDPQRPGDGGGRRHDRRCWSSASASRRGSIRCHRRDQARHRARLHRRRRVAFRRRANWVTAQNPTGAFVPPELRVRPVRMERGLRGAAVVFFAYIGFDAVSTAAQEAKNPQRDMPIGILGSLVICTMLYVAVALVLTGIVPYDKLDVPDPIAVGIDADRRQGWLAADHEPRHHHRPELGDPGAAARPDRGSSTRWRATGCCRAPPPTVHPRFRTPYITTDRHRRRGDAARRPLADRPPRPAREHRDIARFCRSSASACWRCASPIPIFPAHSAPRPSTSSRRPGRRRPCS